MAIGMKGKGGGAVPPSNKPAPPPGKPPQAAKGMLPKPKPKASPMPAAALQALKGAFSAAKAAKGAAKGGAVQGKGVVKTSVQPTLPAPAIVKSGPDPVQQLKSAEVEWGRQYEALENLLLDLSTPDAQVDAALNRIKALRHRLISLHHQVDAGQKQKGMNAAANGPANQGATQEEMEHKRAELVTIIHEVLLKANGPMVLSSLTSDPAIQEARHGVVAKVVPFLQKYPGTFKVYEEASEEGKLVQKVRSVGGIPQEVRELLGLPSKRGKKRKAEAGVLPQDAKRPATQQQQPQQQQKLSEGEKEERQAQLFERICEIIQSSQEGHVLMKSIAEDATVRELRQGMSSLKLKAFIERYPEQLSLQGIGGNEFLVTLV